LSCEIQQIPYVNLLDVFLILPNSQTHYCIGSTLACVDLPLIVPSKPIIWFGILESFKF
jgi:hypothetical protein